jgi:hypothetical protein
MEVISGIVGLGNLLLSAIVGVRLVRLGRKTGGPEIWLSFYFLLAAFFGFGLSNFVYMSWADAGMALPDGLATLLNGLYLFGATAGLAALWVFTWRTFRPDSSWAPWLVTLTTSVLAGGFVATGLSGDFALKLVPGTAYWVTWGVRTLAFAWLSIECFRHWGLQRRRLRIGLADPLIANRFLLWGIWSTAMLLMGHFDPMARVRYVAQFGSTGAFVPELGRPIVLTLVPSSAAAGIVVMATVYLTFFPTESFTRWVKGRAPSSESAT